MAETRVATGAAYSGKPPLRLRFDRFELDENDARLTRDGNPVPLAPRAFAVLCELARAPRVLVTKTALLDGVWGHRFVSDSALKSAISSLRAALDDDTKRPRYIETVSRRGYRFVGSVSTALEPLGAPAPVAVLPAAAGNARSPWVGRAGELARLRAAWQRAAAGQRQIVLIAGDSGVGKSTLIERFVGEVGEGSFAHGQCVDQQGDGEPYLAVLEALTGMCRRDASLADLVRTVAPTWLHQLPWLTSGAERQALQREFAGEGQARMLREFGELLDRYTANRPLLLVTEDMQWSDRATVQLMHYIARRRAGARLLWLASFRPVDMISADHPLQSVRRELRLHGLLEEIFLDSLSEQEVSEYLARCNPSLPTDETFVRALHRRTDGLPLFVADFANDLCGRAEPAIHDARSARLRLASMPLPETSAGIVERHIEQLEPDQRAALEAASVCGLQFRISTVATAMAVDVTALAQPCVELARRGRWLREAALDLQPAPPDAAFMFRHALYREALYRRLAPRARMQLHHRVAIALERDRAEGHDLSAAEVARHLELGHQPAPTPSERSSTILPVLGAVDRKAEMATTRPNSVQAHERARQLRAV